MTERGTPTSYVCTHCRVPLTARKIRSEHFFSCEKCGGTVVSLSVLCLMVQGNHVMKLKTLLTESSRVAGLCPICSNGMVELNAPTLSGRCVLSGCKTCLVLCFDRGDVELAPKINHPVENQLRDFAITKLVDERAFLRSTLSGLLGVADVDFLSLLDF